MIRLLSISASSLVRGAVYALAFTVLWLPMVAACSTDELWYLLLMPLSWAVNFCVCSKVEGLLP